jgi:predicted phosphodiesterase
MRVAVISDIHANLHALEAVLAAIEDEAPDAVWCLGDLVGYGRARTAVARRSRHVPRCRSAGTTISAYSVTSTSRISLPMPLTPRRWTRTVLSDDARTYLEGLSPKARADGVELFHGSPRDPVWDYVLSGEAALDALELTSDPLVLVGHSHVPLAIVLAGDDLAGGLAPGGAEVDLAAGRWLLNPGSVGQPRDGTRVPPGFSSTCRAGLPRSGGSSIRSTERRRRSWNAGCPSRWPARLADGV